MKTSKIMIGLFILITFSAINSLVINVSAQERGKCTATVNSIYFVDPGEAPGTPVVNLHPGRKQYELNILGQGTGYFTVTQTKYMAVLSVKSVSATRAVWHVAFAPNMSQFISSLKMTSKCTAETKSYNLDSTVKLFNQ